MICVWYDLMICHTKLVHVYMIWFDVGLYLTIDDPKLIIYTLLYYVIEMCRFIYGDVGSR